MGSMSACALTENPSTYSYERGNFEKPDLGTGMAVGRGDWGTITDSREGRSACQSSPPTGSRPYLAARRSLSTNSSVDHGGWH